MHKQLLDVNSNWSKKQLIAVTPTVLVGASYDNKECPFDRIFCYGSAMSNNPRDLIQMISRVRHPSKKDPALIFNCYSMGSLNFCLGTLKKIEESEKFRDINLDRLMWELQVKGEWSQLPRWVIVNHRYNTLERNLSKMMYKKILRQYLNANGFTIKSYAFEEEEEAEEAGRKLKSVDVKYDDIKLLSIDEIDELKKKKHTTNLTTEETLQLEKYYFHKKILINHRGTTRQSALKTLFEKVWMKHRKQWIYLMGDFKRGVNHDIAVVDDDDDNFGNITDNSIIKETLEKDIGQSKVKIFYSCNGLDRWISLSLSLSLSLC